MAFLRNIKLNALNTYERKVVFFIERRA
jgi:hypothetical protein